MPKRKLLPQSALRALGSVLGCFGIVGRWCLQWAIIRLGRTRLGQCAFLSLSRTGITPDFFSVIFYAIALYVAIEHESIILLWLSIGTFLLPSLIATHRTRVLTISNRGAGRWNVHLNILSFAPSNMKLLAPKNLRREFSHLAKLAKRASVRQVSFDSPLLVQEETADALEIAVKDVFTKSGFEVLIEREDPTVMPAIMSGMYQHNRRHQKRLRAHRNQKDEHGNYLTRKLILKLS